MSNECERHHAIKNAEEIAASDAYFAARPSMDDAYSRKLFEAGFDRGFDAGEAQPSAPVAQPAPAVADGLDLWKFLRDVLKRGAAIESQFSQQGYETFIAEIESAARKEDKRLRAMLAASAPKEGKPT